MDEREVHTMNVWIELMPSIWKETVRQSNFCSTRMKYFHKHRRPSPMRIYNVEKYMRETNHIDDKKNIKIIRKMKKWETLKTIDTLRVLNANINDPLLFETYIKTPEFLGHYEQIEKFLQPIEVDGIPVIPSNWIQNPKDRRLRLPKIHQINFNCKWEKEPNKILTPATLQIFFNIFNTYKLINESYSKDWEFDQLFGKSKDQIWKIRETIILYNFRENNCPQIDENEITNLRISDADQIDDYINIPTAITILQYLKDRYYKKGNLHLTINRCIKGPIMSWIDIKEIMLKL
jgi:hypothetical protein